MLNILNPFELKNITLKNRLVMSPMCMYSADNGGYVQDFHIIHYGTRAYGGVGTILVEASAVLPEGRISENDIGIWDDSHIKGLTKIVEIIKGAGVIPAIQIGHAGRKAEISGEIFAPSPIAYSGEYKNPKALTKKDIKKIVDAFKTAFWRAKKCGFDIVEIHAAHGYLLNQFLSPLTNMREDEYGYKTYEDRFRIVKEIISEIKSQDDKTPLSIRFSASDYVNGGNTINDIIEFSLKAKQYGVDIVDVSSGGVSLEQKLKVYPGYQVKFAQEIKDKVGISTIAVGLITTLEQCEMILASGSADLIAMGRNLLRNPYFLINRIKEYDIDIAKNIYPKQYLRIFEVK
jgi:NADPH2 dehydrogenase